MRVQPLDALNEQRTDLLLRAVLQTPYNRIQSWGRLVLVRESTELESPNGTCRRRATVELRVYTVVLITRIRIGLKEKLCV
jgi:hypothetical protein